MGRTMLKMLCQAENRTLKMDKGYLDYARFGLGDDVLVLLPGLSLRDVKGAARMLAFLHRIYAEQYTVFVFDKKSVLSDSCTIKELAGDAACAMDQLGIPCADVVGISQGGMIAQELAIHYPELVRKLVLGVTASRCNPVMKDVLQRWISFVEKQEFQEFAADMVQKMYSEAYARKYRRMLPLLTKFVRPKNPRRFIHLAQSCLTCSSFAELHRISCPVLVIGGEQDNVLTAEASREMARVLGCRLFLYPTLGHAAYEEAPDFHARVLQFLLQ